MQKLIRTLGFATLALSLASCRLVYTPDVQQGNILTKENVAELKPGMTKRQVLLLLGTPSVNSPFEHDRWDYVSTQQHRGGADQDPHLHPDLQQRHAGAYRGRLLRPGCRASC